ncbi:ankyrin repeat domain-containing protein [Vagococcus sp. BWB3-3]|uniref:Ankyrin repeat domain-containing protein n=1 Tax=Vagococcus allomyrinae TaxID=2794353 RepID=A0A940PFQ7_9ENTE|nr:ankyrin repeat domain-containing protein [Vagococcus allomyrinae]MBP1043772.1 ankyrin repeat domain-containing protein [Vagococcus allomyrinae]
MKHKWFISLIILGGLLYGCKGEELAKMEMSTTNEEEIVSSESSESIQEVISTERLPVEHFEPDSLLNYVKEGNLSQVANILTDSQYMIDEVDQEGNTPLNVAVHENQVEIAKKLIDRGADINRQNAISDSPYLYAGAEGRTEILAYMLAKAEPDLTKVNRFGGNALIPAAEKGHLDNVALLLKDGRVTVDFQNDYGYTALIETVALNDGSQLYQDIAKVLLEYGASPSLKDKSGRSAMDYAVNYGYQSMIKLMESY